MLHLDLPDRLAQSGQEIRHALLPDCDEYSLTIDSVEPSRGFFIFALFVDSP
jgi:hypothetical protein